MIRKFLLKILLNLYISQNRDIHKLSKEDEQQFLLFKSSLSVENILRSYLTSQTLRYWEAKTDYERAVIRGAGLMLRMLLDKHREAVAIEQAKKK